MSRSGYTANPEQRIIGKGVGSVKFLGSDVADQLYKAAQNHDKTFVEVLQRLDSETCADSRQIENLIKIDYFSEYGNSRELLKIRDIFTFFKNGTMKQMSADKIPDFLKDDISKYATNVNAKGEALKTYKVTDMRGMLDFCEGYIKGLGLPDLPFKVKMENQKEILGYVDLTTNNPEDRRKLQILDVTPLVSKENGETWGYRVNCRSIATGKLSRLSISSSSFIKCPVMENDIIHVSTFHKNMRGYWYLDNYEKIAM